MAEREYAAAPPVPLILDGQVVAEYVIEPRVDPTEGPRPFLHPVRTLAGTVVTDVLPEDQRWHLGVSVAVQDVNGVNLWGGRTYVRDRGYVWRADHGWIEHVDWLRQAGELAHRLRWCAPDGSVLLTEERSVSAVAIDERCWRLDFEYTLDNPNPAPVVLGSPGTNGRPDNAGYGGFYWRAVADAPPAVLGPDTDEEAALNGSTADWVAIIGVSGGQPYTLIFTGREGDDRWFVRAAQFPGVGVALAWERTVSLDMGERQTRRHEVLVVDGALDAAEIGQRVSTNDLVR